MTSFSRNRLFLTTAASAMLASVVTTTSAAPFVPNFAAATFNAGAAIDHPYFPLINAAIYRYQGVPVDEDGDPITESFEFHPVAPGPTILGVQTTTRLDRAFIDGLVAVPVPAALPLLGSARLGAYRSNGYSSPFGGLKKQGHAARLQVCGVAARALRSSSHGHPIGSTPVRPMELLTPMSTPILERHQDGTVHPESR